MSWLAPHDARDLTVVAIAPDLGESCINQSNSVRDSYSEDVLSSTELTAGSSAG